MKQYGIATCQEWRMRTGNFYNEFNATTYTGQQDVQVTRPGHALWTQTWRPWVILMRFEQEILPVGYLGHFTWPWHMWIDPQWPILSESKCCHILPRCETWFESSLSIISAGHIGRMGEDRSAFRISTGIPAAKRPLRRPRRRWEDNIRMDRINTMIGLIRLRIGIIGEPLWMLHWTSGFHNPWSQ